MNSSNHRTILLHELQDGQHQLRRQTSQETELPASRNPFLESQSSPTTWQSNSVELQELPNQPEPPEIFYLVDPAGKPSLALRLDLPGDFKDPKALLDPVTPEEIRLMTEPAYPFAMRDWPPPYSYDERRIMELDEIVNARRRRVFMFMVCLDFFYCLLLLFVSISLGDGVTDKKVSDQTPLVRIFWLCALLTDVMGFVACLKDNGKLLTIFILLEGAAVVGFSFLVFSPLVILRLIIFLLSLQVRIGMHVTATAAAAVQAERT